MENFSDKLIKIQNLLKEYGFDGWLFADFHGKDYITREFLNLKSRNSTRRMFYFIPQCGEPIKVLSAIEPLLLDSLPGEKRLYSGYKGLENVLNDILNSNKTIAIQYSPFGNVPTICSMDAGLVDYLKKFDVNYVSSADLMQNFGAKLTENQIESHKQAGIIIHKILDNAFKWIRKNIDNNQVITEYDLLNEFKNLINQEKEIEMDTPFFGVDENARDPGYEPKPESSKIITEGSRLIVDISGRLKGEDTVYYDVSWCMNVGDKIDSEYERLFNIVNNARKLALDYIQQHLDKGIFPKGCDVDSYLREYFKSLDLDKYILHRTGHNIGHNCHGIGANLDDFETHDDRCLLQNTLFSIEPGIYTEKYGVRLEFDVHITNENKLVIYGPVQDKILII